MEGVKDQIISLFKIKGYSKSKYVYGGGKKQFKGNIIKSIRNLFKLKEKIMEQLKVK